MIGGIYFAGAPVEDRHADEGQAGLLAFPSDRLQGRRHLPALSRAGTRDRRMCGVSPAQEGVACYCS